MEELTNSILFSLNTVELWSSPWQRKMCDPDISFTFTHIHIRNQVILFIGIYEQRRDGKSNEDKSSNEGDNSYRDLLGNQGSTND